jgi:type I restriction enzyme S subunit
MSDGIPQGWAKVLVDDVLNDIQSGFASGDKNVKGGLSHLRMNNIGLEGKLVLDLLRTVPKTLAKPHHVLKVGDVLVCTTNSSALVGKCALFDLSGYYVFSNHLTRLRPNPIVCDNKYLCWNLWYQWKMGIYVDKCKHWVNQSTIPKEELLNTPIPLAPLNEQRRIVAKLEKLLDKVNASQKRLERIPILLKRFRQSVLAAACMGRLTEDWREDDSYEDDIPASWKQIPLEQLLPHGGIFDGPFGSNLKTSDYTESGIRVVRLENIGQLQFIREKETFISHEKYSTLKKHSVGEGDIIFASFIDEEVRACLLPKLETAAIAKADCFCLRPKSELVDRKYLTYQLVSRESYNKLFENIHGATRPRINTTQLRKLDINICSLAEQEEIVRRVEALFALADKIETRYTKAKAQVDKLTQSILAKAFRGELVPQDPNDEPASVLLERIKTATNKLAVKQKRRKKNE